MKKKKQRPFGDLSRQEKLNYVDKMNKTISDKEFRRIIDYESTNNI